MNAQALLQTRSHTKQIRNMGQILPEIQFIYEEKKHKKEQKI